MHFNFISPYKIILYLGLIGSIITLISLLFVSLFECKGNQTDISNYCPITKIEGDNSIKYYHDSIFIYFDELKGNMHNYKFYLEVILITPIFFAINFFGFTCEMLTIYYLNPLYVLVRENLYYFIQRFLFIFVNLDDYHKYTTLTQFIILQSSEVTALLGYAVYLEIIELRFCGFDKDIKRKIMERGEREAVTKPIDIDDDNNFDESFTEEKSNNEESNNQIEMS